uniref:Immunoglobulin domain-containing protein n=1 Tax=Malurus cyaneus samueli TaxID=2593467 RepID=A0A8C5TJA8_9PASS
MAWENLCLNITCTENDPVCFPGQSADVITPTEVVHALPGTDVTLVCIFPKPHTTHIIQTQWSKAGGSPDTKIAVYHPTYGTHYHKCCGGDDTESLCSTNPNATESKCSWWALHLKNVTMSLSGHYECTFATYPYGTKAVKIQLIVKAEVWVNQTLEIPCLEDVTSENLSTYHLQWLVGGNGRKEELVSKKPFSPAVYRSSSALCGRTVCLASDNTLMVFPTKITDDGREFSCHVFYHPERVWKSSTTVRVFGKGLLPAACCPALER